MLPGQLRRDWINTAPGFIYGSLIDKRKQKKQKAESHDNRTALHNVLIIARVYRERTRKKLEA